MFVKCFKGIRYSQFFSYWLLLLTLLGAGVSYGQNVGCLELICPTQVVVECESSDGSYVQFGVSAISHCQTQVTLSCKPDSGTLFPPGETLVTCTASDDKGNVTNCTFTVYVLDSRGPEIFAPTIFDNCKTIFKAF